eukprot:CAMPEP_0182479704 /NCGR_PEP_ID=MMETSP1319-20130603/34615_1 /TAXON_ID=172717 /ORGANISM="Bolidomonas pacifica, Strain RCC208" /LENGTH=386 /DNA_ID=CAMNT_0024681139 /DNA_START=108 /DNA_END=1264 /DNA_ORIENTATION=-
MMRHMSGGALTRAMSTRVFNFSAGPACLNDDVMSKVQGEFTDWRGTGMGIMEMSHRDAGGPVQNAMSSAVSDLRDLLQIPENYHVLFFQGGAHGQFSAIPLNLGGASGGKADYVRTGFWSERALNEGKKYLDCAVPMDAADVNYTHIPDPSTWNIRSDASYVHLCANETIHGLEFLTEPDLGPGAPPLVLDATSTLLSRPMDISKYGMVYASGGKNLGPAGVCVAIIRDDLVRREPHPLTPSVLDFALAADSQPIPSVYNTPPTFLLYVVSEVLQNVQQRGGMAGMEDRAMRLSGSVYDVIDNSDGFYVNSVRPEHRSRMNCVFRIGDGNEALEDAFTREAEEQGMHQLFKHPLFKGLRITLYNGLPDAAVDAVVQFMRDFKQKHS